MDRRRERKWGERGGNCLKWLGSVGPRATTNSLLLELWKNWPLRRASKPSKAYSRPPVTQSKCQLKIARHRQDCGWHETGSPTTGRVGYDNQELVRGFWQEQNPTARSVLHTSQQQNTIFPDQLFIMYVISYGVREPSKFKPSGALELSTEYVYVCVYLEALDT